MNMDVGEFPRRKNGANDGDRTRDNRYHKPALYQLSYIRHIFRYRKVSLFNALAEKNQQSFADGAS